MNEELAELRGHLHAMNLLLTHVIAQLPPLAAARAASALSMEHHSTSSNELQDGTSPLEAQARQGLTSYYLSALTAAASRG